jgi:hypothetical protein
MYQCRILKSAGLGLVFLLLASYDGGDGVASMTTERPTAAPTTE